MKLSYLLNKLTYTAGTGLCQPAEENGKVLAAEQDIEITAVVNDSRKVADGSLFYCIPGVKVDGHTFAKMAVEKGAAALIVEHEVDLAGISEEVLAKTVIIKVADARYAMAVISAAFYGNPGDKLKVIGVTGTKGKTTTTYLIKSILEKTGKKVGLIGTIETIIEDEHIPASNTTPESLLLQQTFAKMLDRGIEYVVMEVSSQALKMHRTAGFTFDVGVFTNLEPDHIGAGEHESFEEYLYCKSLLFRQCRAGIVNGDDAHTEEMIANATCPITRFGMQETDDLRAENLMLLHVPGELGIAFDTKGIADFHAEIPTPGKFSVYNALCAIGVCLHYGVNPEDIKAALRTAKVKGRIEMVPVSDAFTLMIDYAHNAMALRSLLMTLKAYEPGRLVCLFGCGGNRSRLRRFEMGETSGELADLTVITSDNPRDEEPMDIIHDIETGIGKTTGKHISIPDRKEAIRYCIENGQPGDIIVLAGKGHEDYQEIKGKKYPMDERVLIAEVLAEMNGIGN